MRIQHLLLGCSLFFAAATAHAERPKLVVAILVDQLRYDYMERFHHQFVDGGLKLLTDKGAFMTFAHYDYSPTVTAPGHASFFSGAPPSMHGVIGNEWFDKTTRKMLNCVSDPTVNGVGVEGSGGKLSPRNFIGGTFADQLRLAYRSKVVGISFKDRGAILPAGKNPTGAFWFESGTGNFVTSSYYMAELPAWVVAFNKRKRAESFLGQTWDRLLDEKAYEYRDNAPGEGRLAGEQAPTFPHVITRLAPPPRLALEDEEGGEKKAPATPAPVVAPPPAGPPKLAYGNIAPTPFGNQLLTEFAQAAIEGEQLGQGPGPDLLTISFSSLDACGHIFGPYSQEVQDLTLRLDRQLAELFAYLDKKVGLGKVAIVLTADHGVAPLPEFATEHKLDGYRSNETALVGDLLAKLGEKFGSPNILLTRRIIDGNIYFNHDALKEKNLNPNDVAAFVREWALGTGKFQAAFTRDQLLDGRVKGIIGERVFLGYHAERSGDVVVVYKPFTISWGSSRSGTTHGSPYSYDTHIPIIFYGSLFKAGRYPDEFAVTDAVPTLCAALRIEPPPTSIGKPLGKLLANP